MQARKKGVLSKTDIQKRYMFARNTRREFSSDVCMKQVVSYIHGVSFICKTNPADKAKAPKGRIWRRANEGMDRGCTAKGSQEGSGGKVVKMMVAVSHGAGVVLCDQYKKLDGSYFRDLVFREFPQMFKNARKGQSRLWLQDGDPSQSSSAARMAMKSIPACSPDINPIENVFHLIKRKLNSDALQRNIKKEIYEEFSGIINLTCTRPINCIKFQNYTTSLYIA